MRSILFVLALWLGAAGAWAQETRPASRGQSLYLPIYSHLLYGNVGRSGTPSRVLLSALVSIRNTDPRQPMKVLAARYYDTHGRFLRDYLGAPTVVPPFGTLELFVELHDESGGSGANFLIRWESEGAINPPLVEGLHANMDSGKAVILTTRALPVQE
ncbi:MAG: DUF3124 domain-containing protein [Azonexus sp.]|jgi:hypothetical protein|nr:DUF3124 domain-containing protein [Betaproteobacteria bacterium]MBK8918897.1 DUF3124 domain-containing protein [Betaproteobacteria bacterium]MBP6034828.1 DUF3124 domain-containing protein [Azonexus sp.]MBP6905368.1 DUF3124 domain-containing protein [Azonexus sp.]